MKLSDLTSAVKDTMGRLAQAGLLSLHIGGKPVPASRPKVSRWGTYYSPTYKRWMAESQEYIRYLDEAPTDKPLAVFIEVVCPAPKQSKFNTPMGDVDNFMKGPLDLLTKSGKTWGDDRQIVFVACSKRWAKDENDEIGFHIRWCEVKP